MGNFSFICGTHEQNHEIKDELCGKNNSIFSVFAYKYYQLKKMNKRKLAVKFVACLVLVATVAIEFIQHAFYFTHRFEFTAFRHISMCAMWASSDVRCRFLEHFFLALSCFGSGGAGLASPGRSASASVPEPRLSRHAAGLHFADFCSPGDLYCVSHPVFHNSLDITVLLVLVVAVSCLAFLRFQETIRVILFIDDSLRVERQYALG